MGIASEGTQETQPLAELPSLHYTGEQDLRTCKTPGMQGCEEDIQRNYAKRYYGPCELYTR
jgi:hypothetical protein